MQRSRQTGPNIRLRLGAGVLCALVIALAGMWEGRRLLNDPKIVLLLPEDGAQWIQVPRATSLNIWLVKSQSMWFRTIFQVPPGFSGAEIKVRALHDVKVFVDGTLLFQSDPNMNWKVAHRVELPAGLGAGQHGLILNVGNPSGPALTLVVSPKLNIRSGGTWESSGDGQRWVPAVVADTPKDPPMEFLFSPCLSDIAAMSPLLVILFAAGFGVALLLHESRGGRDWVKWLRWGLLLAWGLFAINTYFKFPSYVGYDVREHRNYIHFIVLNGRIPLPDEGWEFFQAPLFYLLSALFYRLIAWAGVPGDIAVEMLRVVPLLCCIGIVEVCWRSARMVFLARGDLQVVAMVIGGLMPMNLYMAPAISNEPMAGLIGSLIVLSSFYFLLFPKKIVTLRWQLLYGGLLGIGMLTKITTVLWLGPILFVVVVCFHQERAGVIRWAKSVAVIAGISLSICSWFYVRNWIKSGSAFLPEAQTGANALVQDPGFRTPHQFLEFGRVFARPIYSGMNSLWDALYGTLWADGFMSGVAVFKYRPPWNYRLMSCGLWLSVFPMLAILAGAGRCILLTLRQIFTSPLNEPGSGNPRQLVISQFAVLASGGFVGAIALEYLKNPIYGAAKATYMLGLIPCFAVLGAMGFEILPNQKIVRALAAGVLSCWGVVVFMTYWIV